MTVVAQLKVVLKADDTIVAESNNPALWHQILIALNTSSSTLHPAAPPSDKASNSPLQQIAPATNKTHATPTGNTISTFAIELGVSDEVLIGACDPQVSAPLIHLNEHHWEALKACTPKRGPGAVAPATLAATILVLWCQKNQLPPPTRQTIQETLATIHLSDKRVERSIKNCEWLQLRGNNIVLNPASTSRALQLATAYCRKEAPFKET